MPLDALRVFLGPGRMVLRQFRQISIWSVLLVLCLGLQRLLVVCSGPHCHGSIEFAHASGSCCEDHHGVQGSCDERDHGSRDHGADEDGDGDVGESVAPGPCGCTDVPVAIEEGPLPEGIVFEFHDIPAITGIDSWFAYVPSPQAATVQPPATGPPRTDRRTQLLATTLLLI